MLGFNVSVKSRVGEIALATAALKVSSLLVFAGSSRGGLLVYNLLLHRISI
jgi:hypothetical protein